MRYISFDEWFGSLSRFATESFELANLPPAPYREWYDENISSLTAARWARTRSLKEQRQ